MPKDSSKVLLFFTIKYFTYKKIYIPHCCPVSSVKKMTS